MSTVEMVRYPKYAFLKVTVLWYIQMQHQGKDLLMKVSMDSSVQLYIGITDYCGDKYKVRPVAYKTIIQQFQIF